MHTVIRSGVALFMLICVQSSVFAKEGSFGSDGDLVYKDMVGGPYFDEWYVAEDISQLNDIKIYREGKSGLLEAIIKVDCKLQTVTAQGTAFIYGSITLPKEEAQEYFSADITKAIVNKICMH
ncbi:hypothetical protein [Vibrio campbellii]|uniref:Uncharacterized protein n=1 Tax=Vibrio campbellii TaxID=680 RepID=A0ABY5IHW1_9VIBR|nr:hypothetical protein [Vibrio campbellii]UTZ24797.1 hypothetical protein HB760_24260 [Vibrio campbellii]UTZ33075.1 hypothetical protein HB762_17235 [Vibrio campbellii]